jgi:hypothetical protein
VILGLVALCAVVGWRSRTRIGAFLRSQMVGLLIATAVLGQMVPIIDNWGHAGGALAGAAIGFTHRILIRTPKRPVAKWLGSLAVLLLAASGAAQIHDNRIEARASRLASAHTRLQTLVLAESQLRTVEQTLQALQDLKVFYRLAAKRSLFERMPLIHEVDRRGPSEALHQGSVRRPSFVKPLSLLDSSDEEFRAELRWQLDLLDERRALLGTGPTATDFQRVRALLAQVLSWPPSERLALEFDAHLGVLYRYARRKEANTRAEVEALRHDVPLQSELNRPARWPARRPAGAGDGPTAVAVPR